MGLIKGAAAAAVVGAGALAYTGLSRMDSDDIRAYGDKIKGMVSSLGSTVSSTGFASEIKEKLQGTQVGGFVLSAAESAGSSLSNGFDSFIGAIADAKEASERDGSSFAGNLLGGLTNAVSQAAEFVSENAPTADNVGRAAANYFFGEKDAAEEAPSYGDGPDV